MFCSNPRHVVGSIFRGQGRDETVVVPVVGVVVVGGGDFKRRRVVTPWQIVHVRTTPVDWASRRSPRRRVSPPRTLVLSLSLSLSLSTSLFLSRIIRPTLCIPMWEKGYKCGISITLPLIHIYSDKVKKKWNVYAK